MFEQDWVAIIESNLAQDFAAQTRTIQDIGSLITKTSPEIVGDIFGDIAALGDTTL